MISLLLFWQLCERSDTPVTKKYAAFLCRPAVSHEISFLTRITCVLVEAGALTAAVTIIGSVVSLGRTRDTMGELSESSDCSSHLPFAIFTVWIIFAFIQARVYSCTMLFVLNGRPESASALTGNAVETAHIGVSLRAYSWPYRSQRYSPIPAKGPRDMGMMVLAAVSSPLLPWLLLLTLLSGPSSTTPTPSG